MIGDEVLANGIASQWLDRLNSLGGQHASTDPPVRREVNPLINAMLVLEDLEDTDVMKVQVKDIGMFNSSHFMGSVGPQVIASTTVAVKEEVDGYFELSPINAFYGPPVIHMKVRWLKIGDHGGLPTPGSTSSLVDTYQALAVTPSAPLAEQTGENTDTTTNTKGVDNQASCEVWDPASSGAGCSGVTASSGSGDPAPQPTMFSSPSSVFHVDPAVFHLAKPNDFLRILLQMQQNGGTVHPFPASVTACSRDYSCLGAGFDRTKGQHATVWGPIEDQDMPKGLEDVHKAMETFADKVQANPGQNPHACYGVLVLLAWLKTLKEDSSS